MDRIKRQDYFHKIANELVKKAEEFIWVEDVDETGNTGYRTHVGDVLVSVMRQITEPKDLWFLRLKTEERITESDKESLPNQPFFAMLHTRVEKIVEERWEEEAKREQEEHEKELFKKTLEALGKTK